MDLSVIIPIYNSEKTIRECLISILNSDFDRSFEVIIVDDGSTDKSIEKIKDLGVQIIRRENKGAAAARNAGAEQARSDLLIFVDSDVVFFKDTLKRVYGHLKKDDVDYVTGRYSKKPLNQKWIHKYKALADYSYNYDFIFTREQKQKPIRHATISGGIEGWKKKVFAELGAFDENIKGAGVEREKLVSRLSQDYNILTDGNIRTGHNFPDFIKLIENYFYRTFDSMDLMLKNNYKQPVLKKNITRCALGALTVISFFISLALFLIFGYTLPFIPVILIFSGYFLTHLNMFIIAFKEYGFLFTLYALIMNLFFCALVSLAGFLGAVKSLLRI